MTMTKDEVVQRIMLGSEFLNRDDITDEQRAKGETKMRILRQLLRELDTADAQTEPEEPEFEPVPEGPALTLDDQDPSATWRETIRAMLQKGAQPYAD